MYVVVVVIFCLQNNQHVALMIYLPLSNVFHRIVSLVLVKYWQCEETYCGVIGCDVEKNFRGTSAGHISVAVPHAGYHVGLKKANSYQVISA